MSRYSQKHTARHRAVRHSEAPESPLKIAVYAFAFLCLAALVGKVLKSRTVEGRYPVPWLLMSLFIGLVGFVLVALWQNNRYDRKLMPAYMRKWLVPEPPV
ncbi:hypothetical protein DIPPA_54490 [Diplonema papillatum]|nr:hypothetical protein DIPPA_54490 [Diplonema papillatum]